MASTLDTTFEHFKEWLMSLFAATYTPKDSTYVNTNAYKEFGKQMLMQYDYSPECEEFLIRQAKHYIESRLDFRQSHNVSLIFLEKLMNKIAEHLSYYVVQKHPMPESPKSQNKLRLKVQSELKAALFDNNRYIINLKAQQAANRDLRRKPKDKRKSFIEAKKRSEREAAYIRTREIRAEFVDAQRTPRKPR